MFNRRSYPPVVALALATTLLFGSYLLARSAEPAAPTSTITVNSTDDSTTVDSNCTLREAIEAANTDSAVDACTAGSGADIIAFDLPTNSTITLNGSQLPAIHNTLTISGTEGLNLTINGDKQRRIFAIGNGIAVTMTHLTIIDGKSNFDGGGIWNAGLLVLVQSTLSGNEASDRGGGIFNSGTLNLHNSTLSDNSATEDGGGIYNVSNSAVTVQNSTVSGNSAEHGGGIYNNDGDLTMSNSTLGGNSATSWGGGIVNHGTLTVQNSTLSDNSATWGGGIYNDTSGTVTMSNSTLSGNSADSSGGGILNYEGTLAMSNSTLNGNSGNHGGGIYNRHDGTVSMTNSTLSGNSAINWGGGIMTSGDLTMSNSTLSGNSAALSGGGIFNNFGTVTMNNSTLSGNSADAGGGIYNNTDGTLAVTNSIIANSPSGEDCKNNGSITTFKSNILESGDCGDDTIDDSFLGPLQDNGGPTFTHALLPNSPALDTADITACLAFDQRGVGRPQGSGCDIGAFESRGFTPPVADAGPDQQVPPGTTVQLDGSDSYDPDGEQPLTYLWEQTGGPVVTLSDSAAVSPTFATPESASTLTFTLTVTDNYSYASTDEVVVKAEYAVYLPLLQR